MVATIARKECISHLKTFRFTAGFILCILLVSLSTAVLRDKYLERLSNYHLSQNESAEELKQVRVYSYLQPVVHKPPSVLSIFSQGIEEQVDHSVRIYWGRVPTPTVSQSKENPYLVVFSGLDVVKVISVLLSLLAVLFTFDAIAGEKELGTLKFSLANSVSRTAVIIGKYAGALVSLLLPLATGFLIALSWILASKEIAVSARDWAGVMLIFLSAFIYTSTFLTLGLFVSTLTHRRSTSLISLLFTWVLLVIVVPNVAPFMAKRVVRTRSPQEVAKQENRLHAELSRKINDHDKRIESLHRYSKYWGRRGEDSRYFARFNPSGIIEYRLKKTQYDEPLKTEYATKIFGIEQDYYRELQQQAQAANRLASLSPLFHFRKLASTIAATDFQSHEDFLEHTRVYRGQLINYLNSKDAFNSHRFFSDDASIEEGLHRRALIDKEREKSREAGTRMQVRLNDDADKDPNRLLKLDGMPRFSYGLAPPAERFFKGLANFSVLVFLNAGLLAMAYVVFLKYDVR